MTNTVMPFDRERLGDCLSRLGVRWLQSPTGTFVANFEGAVKGEQDSVTVLYRAEGEGGEILSVAGHRAETHPMDAWPFVIGILNSWNSSYRLPKAILALSDDEGRVITTVDTFLEGGVHDELLLGLLSTSTRTIIHCHRWLRAQLRSVGPAIDEAVTADDLEEWFRRAS